MNTFTSFLRGQNDSYYYPYGNSLPEDAFLHHTSSSSSSSSLSALYLGSGDLRNVFQTISEARRKRTTASLQFTLNDWQPEVIARNALLMFTLVADPSVSPAKVARFWYSLELSKEDYTYWTQKMTEFLFFPSLSGLLKMDKRTHDSVCRVMKGWIECDWSIQSMRQKRKKFLEKNANLRQTTVKKQVDGITRLFVHLYVANKASAAFQIKLEEECHAVISSGVFERGDCVNPTMLLVQQDGSYLYGVHYGTNPFEGHINKTTISLVENVENNIEKWMADFREMLPNITSIQFNTEHAVHFMDSLIIKKEAFDVVDTSNLADHVGLLNLLVSGSRLLKNPNESILKSSSFLLYNFADSRSDYLKIVTGMCPFVYPTLLGLHLKEPNDQNLLSHLEPFQRNIAALAMRNSGRNYEFFTWTKAELPASPVSLSDSMILIAQLVKSIETLLPNYEKLDGPGTSNITPGFYGKLLSFAFAEGRLSSSTMSTDLSLPDLVTSKIFNSRKLSGVSGETMLGLSLFSFTGSDIDEPIKISHVFVGEEMNVMTPALALFIQTGPVQHIVTSLEVETIDPTRIKITCYLPGFLREYDPKTIAVQLYYKIFTMGVQQFLPFSKWIPVSKVQKIEEKDPAFEDLRRALVRDVSVSQPLEIMSLVESRTGFEVKLKLTPETENSTFKLNESGIKTKLFRGLLCDNSLISISLPCPTTTEKVQIHRKSGFVLLKLLKLEYEFPCPKVSITGLMKQKQVPYTSMVTMFTPNEVKANKKQLTLYGLEKQKFEMKENLHILFVRANEGWPVLAIQVDGKAVGMIYYHAILKHPPIDFTHEWTSVLDCSYVVFEHDELLSRRVMSKLKECQCLMLDRSEFEQFKDVLKYFEDISLYTTPHSSTEWLGSAVNRIAVMPLYEYVVEPLHDSNSKKREQLKMVRKKQIEFAESMNNGGPEAAMEMMAGLMEGSSAADLEGLMSQFGQFRM